MVMMLIIEFLNVRSHGHWNRSFAKRNWKQYVFAGLVGIIPGCLGPYLIVSLYTHNILSFGALLTAFIATTGDESYVMLSLFPQKAMMLSGMLLVIGMAAGFITDRVYTSKPIQLSGKHFDHDHGCVEIKMSFRTVYENLRNISFPRAILVAGHLLFIYGILAGYFNEGDVHNHGAEETSHFDWIGASFALTTFLALFIVLIVPDHFLEDHLWGHIIKKHFPRIFLWTVGSLTAITLAQHFFDLEAWIRMNKLPMMLIAVLVGLIPVSGPHLAFVTLFYQGALPFSILMINSLVQDGHGSLPLLAESKSSFVKIKLIKCLLALIIGIAGFMFKF